MKKKWTKETILADAKKYPSRKVWFKASPGAYNAAKQLSFFEEAVSHMTRPIPLNIKWTKEAVLEDAKKFISRDSWRKGSCGAYEAAKRLGVFEEASDHMIRPLPHNYKWTKEEIFKSASDFDSVGEWKENCGGSYNAANRLGIFEQAAQIASYSLIQWTEELIYEDALKYKTRGEWYHAKGNAAAIARKMGIFDKAVEHMDLLRKNWTKDTVIESAKRFDTISDWQKELSGAYAASRKLSAYEEAISHMQRGSASSKQEKLLLNIVKERYPSAQKVRIGRTIKGQYGTSFELDIYIPELRKGVEFNGDYWHTVKGLRRGRSKWPEEMLAKYHDLKREFFNKQDVEYIEIWESDWANNSDQCKQTVFDFLNRAG